VIGYTKAVRLEVLSKAVLVPMRHGSFRRRDADTKTLSIIQGFESVVVDSEGAGSRKSNTAYFSKRANFFSHGQQRPKGEPRRGIIRRYAGDEER
jgi:hypothetical protein